MMNEGYVRTNFVNFIKVNVIRSAKHDENGKQRIGTEI
jgi:hypothetical protein